MVEEIEQITISCGQPLKILQHTYVNAVEQFCQTYYYELTPKFISLYVNVFLKVSSYFGFWSFDCIATGILIEKKSQRGNQYQTEPD